MPNATLAELRQADLAQRRIEVAVLPVGSCEVHAMHLPYGTDAMVIDAVAKRAAARAVEKGAPVLCLPVQFIGCAQNLTGFPGTLTLRPTTLIRIIEDIAESLLLHGIRKLLLLNGHGGNSAAIGSACREMYDRKDFFVARMNYWDACMDVIETVRETKHLEHADEMETSVALALFPELVKMEHAVPVEVAKSRLPLLQKYGGDFTRPWHLYTTNGGTGDPTKGTREKGEKILAACVERIGDVLVELASAKMDERFPY
jgi:creatinine amidohydrolase